MDAGVAITTQYTTNQGNQKPVESEVRLVLQGEPASRKGDKVSRVGKNLLSGSSTNRQMHITSGPKKQTWLHRPCAYCNWVSRR